MKRLIHPSTFDRRGQGRLAPQRAFLFALVALVVGCSFFVASANAQQPESPSEAAPPSIAEDEPQLLHDAASLEQAGEAPTPEKLPPAATEKPTAEPAIATPVRDLLAERLEEGYGREPGDLSFDDEGVAYVLITTEPHETKQHARNELERRMLEAASARYADATNSPRVEFWYPVDLEFVRVELLVPNGERFLTGAGGQPKVVGHGLLKFDEAFERRLRAVRVASRSMQVVVAGGSALALLSVAFAFLRLDRATRGLYTGRLQTWAIVAGAVVVCAAGAVAYWIPWI